MEKHEHELTGSFALNALSDAEREQLLRTVQESKTSRDELNSLQDTAAQLGLLAEPVMPPPRLKEGIMSAIRNTPQLPPVTEEAAPEQTHEAPVAFAQEEISLQEHTSPLGGPNAQTRQRMFALAAAVLFIAAATLGGLLVNQNAHQNDLEARIAALNSQQTALNQLLTAPDAHSVSKTLDDGARISLAYSATQGAMAVTTSDLPALPSDKGYELWLISADGAASAGMISGTDANGMVMVNGSMDGVTHFGITVEPSTGSPAPTTDPILVQEL